MADTGIQIAQRLRSQRSSRALPDRPELDETTASDLAAKLRAAGWTRYADLENDVRFDDNFNTNNQVLSFWTRATGTAPNVTIRPEPWARPRIKPDPSAGPTSSLERTLSYAGWLRAADAPDNVTAAAEASPDWQTSAFFTATDPATPYPDVVSEEWIRPINDTSINQYYALAQTTYGRTTTDVTPIDDAPDAPIGRVPPTPDEPRVTLDPDDVIDRFQYIFDTLTDEGLTNANADLMAREQVRTELIEGGATVAQTNKATAFKSPRKLPKTKIPVYRPPGRQPRKPRSNTPRLEPKNDMLASIASGFMPRISILPTAARGSPGYTAQNAIATAVNRAATTLARKATNLLATTVQSRVLSAAKDLILTGPPAPVETRTPSFTTDPITDTDVGAGAYALDSDAQAAARATSSEASLASPGFHFQEVTSAGGGTATVSIPDAIAAFDNPVSIAEIAPQLEQLAAVGEQASVLSLAGDTVAGGVDFAAADIAAGAAAETGALSSIGAAIPYVGWALAAYSAGRALGIFGPSGLYAHTAGYHITGTLSPAGFTGTVTGRSTNGTDNYEFPLSNTGDYLWQLNQTGAQYYRLKTISATIPLDLYTGVNYNDDYGAYLDAYAKAHKP